MKKRKKRNKSNNVHLNEVVLLVSWFFLWKKKSFSFYSYLFLIFHKMDRWGARIESRHPGTEPKSHLTIDELRRKTTWSIVLVQ